MALIDIMCTGGRGGGPSPYRPSRVVIAGGECASPSTGTGSISSRCGSADLDGEPRREDSPRSVEMSRAINEVGIAFCSATAIPTSMKHAQQGGSSDVAAVFKSAGDPDQHATPPQTWSARHVAAERAGARWRRDWTSSDCGGFVGHGSDGLDEITTTGETIVCEITGGR